VNRRGGRGGAAPARGHTPGADGALLHAVLSALCYAAVHAARRALQAALHCLPVRLALAVVCRAAVLASGAVRLHWSTHPALHLVPPSLCDCVHRGPASASPPRRQQRHWKTSRHRYWQGAGGKGDCRQHHGAVAG